MDAAVIIVHYVRLVPRVYAQDTVIFEQAGFQKSHLRGFPLVCGALDLLCAGRDWDSFLYHCKWTSSLEAERLRGRERSLQHEVQVLIDGKPVRTLARQSASSEKL